MPTGYTASVADGKVADFPTFALTCARVMGATILMRDDSLDTPIPEAFEPSDYYSREIARLTEELARLTRMSPKEQKAAVASAFREAQNAWQKRRDERAQTRARYTEMLAHVEAWEPPSSDHVGLKDFMRQQLQESLTFDCSDEYDTAPIPLDGATWHAAEVKRAQDRFNRARFEHLNEVERVASRNHWLRQLRASLSSSAGKVA